MRPARSGSFSALQRAEIAEIHRPIDYLVLLPSGFSALQRAEIAEINASTRPRRNIIHVSVLFNEPKLLKSIGKVTCASKRASFSALQRAEIAEIGYVIWIT